VHLSVMRQNRIDQILSFDSGFDAFPRNTRLSWPPAKPGCSGMNDGMARGAKCDQVFLNPKTTSEEHQNLTYIPQAFSMHHSVSTLNTVALLSELAAPPCA
jgi:hypothetical protein